MRKKTNLSKRQIEVIEDIFSGESDEQAVLAEHNVTAKLYAKWQADTVFIERFESRIAAAHRQSAALIARYAPVAAAKLVQLTQSEKPEIARRACLDIISISESSYIKPESKVVAVESADDLPRFSEQTASKILTLLAEETQN